jgi:hypothetical protein
MSRFTINAIKYIVEREHRETFFLPLSLGNRPGIPKCSISRKVEYTIRRDREKGLRLVNTPTLTWVYTRTERIYRKGKKRSVTRPTLIGSLNQRGCCLSK